VWTKSHRIGAELSPLRARGDVDADAYVVATRPAPAEDSLARILAPDATAVDLAARQIFHADPPWVDWTSVARGQDVFVRTWPVASTALFYMSLVGGFSAPLITEVIRCTGYLTGAGRATPRRLFETFQMVIDAALSGESGMRAGGDGWAAVLRVRLLHAKVRRRLLLGSAVPPDHSGLDSGRDAPTGCPHAAGKPPPTTCKRASEDERKAAAYGKLAGEDQGKVAWDTLLFGVPINQEDMAVTLLAFSVNVIDGIELVQGWPLYAVHFHPFA
jgi:hypothetical protein